MSVTQAARSTSDEVRLRKTPIPGCRTLFLTQRCSSHVALAFRSSAICSIVINLFLFFMIYNSFVL
jgi:hypothetical protein